MISTIVNCLCAIVLFAFGVLCLSMSIDLLDLTWGVFGIGFIALAVAVLHLTTFKKRLDNSNVIHKFRSVQTSLDNKMISDLSRE